MQKLKKKLKIFCEKQNLLFFVILFVLLVQAIVASIFFIKINDRIEDLTEVVEEASFAANQTIIKQNELDSKMNNLQSSNMMLQSQILRSNSRQ